MNIGKLPPLHKSLYQIFILLLEQGEKASTIEDILGEAMDAVQKAKVKRNERHR